MLESPLKLPCGATLSNRIAKASMSEQLAHLDRSPSSEMLRLYERWGASGAALLLSGHVMIDAQRLSEAGNVAIDDERHLVALRSWARAGRGEGAHFMLQLNHPGRQVPRTLDSAPVAPSPVPLKVGAKAFAPPRALTEAEIEDIIQRFARTAAVTEKAGFSGVQIHAAHGYLISQFLSPLTNQRRDDWGGDAKRRRRFLEAIVGAVRQKVGAEFAVSVKLNSADFQRGGITEEESLGVIEALGDQKVDLLEVSGGTYERAMMFEEAVADSTRQREAFFLDFTEKARRVANMPLMLTGGFRTRRGMEEALASGAVDVIGMARPFAVEPELPQALLEGSKNSATPVRLATGLKTLDSMLTGAWHQAQLQRMGRGKEPKLSLSRAGAMWLYARDALKNGRKARGV